MKRLLAVLLTVVLLFTSVPVVVLAEMPSDFQTRFNIDKLDEVWKDSDGVEYETLILEYQLKGTGLCDYHGAWLAIDLTKLIWVHNTKDGNSILSRIGEGKTFVPGGEIKQFSTKTFFTLREVMDEDEDSDTYGEVLDQWVLTPDVGIGVRVSADQKTLYINPQPRQLAIVNEERIHVNYADFTTIVSFRLAVVPGAELSTDSIRYAALEESGQSYVVLMNDGASQYRYEGEGGSNHFVPVAFTGTAGITGQAPAAKVDAVKPVISADPAGASYFVGAEATLLTVTATVTDGGTLSYEWFKNTTASTEGGVSVGTGATYTPATDALGDAYYYVVVTNTNEAATGAKTATATSAVAKISVSVDPDVEAIEAATAALEAATWTPIAQETANTKEDVLPILQEQAKAIVNNDKVTVTVEVTDFTAAVEGSAATTKEGTNGKAVFTVKAEIGNESYTLSAQEVVIKARPFDGRLDSEVIADAETALNAVVWADIAQVTANTKDDVQAKLLEQAQAAVNNSRVTVTVEVTAFDAAVAGSAATTHEGTNGKAVFTVKAVCGAEEYSLTGKEIAITATPYDDKLDSEVIAEVETALNGATWTEIAQETANTKETVQAKLTEQAQAVVNNDKVTVTVEVTDFTAAVEGTAATTKEGTNGKAIFTVKAEIGNEEYTLSAQEVVIKARPFDGRLDSEVIADAETALNAVVWADIAQVTANTKEDVQAKLTEQAQAAVNNSRVTVTVEVTAFDAAVAGSAATTHEGTNGKAVFTVKAVCGAEEYSLTGKEIAITATPYDDKLDSEVIADAETALNAVVWADIAQVTANTKDEVQAKLLEQAQAAVNNSRVTVTVEVTAFDAAVAGSAATTHEGTNGKAVFTVKAVCGAEEYTLTGKEIAITATPYDDKLDSEVIAEVETALNGATWTEIAQETANTKETVQAKLTEQAQTVVNNDKVTVTVEVTDFTAAVEGTPATTKEGTNGKAIFTVKATIGNEEYTLSAQEVVIKARLFNGKLDSEVIEDVKTALTNAVWAEIAQATANTKEAAQAQLKTQAERIINNTRVSVTVEATAFEAAVAGSAATTHEGTNGKVIFTVYATVGAEEYELGNLSAVVKATPFNGVLDKDAVKAAQDTLTDCLVIVKIGADADEILEAIEKYLDSKMTGNAEGVTVTIESVTDNQYKLIMTKGGQTVEKTIEITVEEEDPIKLNAPADLVFADGIASWGAVANAVSYTVSLYEVVDGTFTLLTTANAAQNQCDFNALIEDGKYYAFDVCALGDGVYFLDSDVSDFSEVYRKGNTIEQILAVLIALRNSKYAITAEAGEGGVISGEGVTKVKYGNDITYHIAAMPGYEIDRVIVDGKDVGAVSEYTFENVKKKHTITVTFKEAVWVNPFTDVSEADPYYDAVRFVYDCKLFNGISETEFAPQMSMTRAMFVTVLWRLEGMPVVNYLMQYDDVADETWYTEAIRWATAEGIVEGYGDGIFGTDDAVTVQQATVIMARYAQYAGVYTAPTANMDIFADNADVADWAVEAMAWAVENGIYVPENGKLNPTAMAPRSLAAQFMHAYVVKFSK